MSNISFCSAWWLVILTPFLSQIIENCSSLLPSWYIVCQYYILLIIMASCCILIFNMLPISVHLSRFPWCFYAFSLLGNYTASLLNWINRFSCSLMGTWFYWVMQQLQKTHSSAKIIAIGDGDQTFVLPSCLSHGTYITPWLLVTTLCVWLSFYRWEDSA